MKVVARRPECMTDRVTHYCPGCTHGVAHRLVGEAIDHFGVAERAVGLAPVGCAVLIHDYFNIDFQQVAHGRAPAVATGIKRASPDSVVFTYQGDGDLAAIGTAEIIHAAARGENITVIFINNAIYGMTGGQMAPTTMVGQHSTTTPGGRLPQRAGYPLRIAEMMSMIEGVQYAARVSLHDPVHVARARKSVQKAFATQLQEKGFSLVEILSTCPTNWGLTPSAALGWLTEHMIPIYPLGEFRVDGVRQEVGT